MDLAAAALTREVKAHALELGFDRVAVGPAARPAHGEAFERWLTAGYAGEMDYLARGREARLDPAVLLPGVRSVVAVALVYQSDAAAEGRGWKPIARYARGRDYHDVIRPRLVALGERIRELAGPAIRCRACVDTSAVLERDLAAQAGLGWIGKNTNLLDQGLGSFFFIGIVLTTAVLSADGQAADRCGSCTACLDACPTSAFVAPYVLDARRCISYLTIEHRGDLPPTMHGAIGSHVYGCDVCQEVCPWNAVAPRSADPRWQPRPAWDGVDITTLAARNSDELAGALRGSAMQRAKVQGLRRNIEIALANARTD